MNQTAAKVLEDADLVLFIVDGTHFPPHPEDLILIRLLDDLKEPPLVILAINKIDLVPEADLQERQQAYLDKIPQAIPVQISAVQGDHLDDLLDTLGKHLPQGGFLYPPEQITDLYEREIAADLIRAAGLLHLRDEVPHAIAIRVDEYTERGDSGVYIQATLFVERDSQKGIVIGQGGRMLKQIGTTARREIELMSGRKAFLKLRVKVRKNWRNDDKALSRFGF